MKTKQILIFLASLFFTLLSYPTITEAQDNPPDSCLKYPIGTDEFPMWNPDSVKIDSCIASPTYRQMYATKFKLQFKEWVYIFKTKPLNMDSVYTWEDIDSYHLELQSLFYELTYLFGEYHIKRHPMWIDDESFIEVPTVLLIFDKYIHANSLLNYLAPMYNDSINYLDINQEPVLLSVTGEDVHDGDYIIKIINNDKLNIRRKVFDGEQINVNIYDVIGNLITKHTDKYDGEEIQIDISYLQSGFYIVAINNKIIYKLIKY